MADHSKIEWTDASWNPVTGCTEVSPGCDHCYAKTFAERFRGTPGHYFERGFDVVLRPERLDQPLRWKKPRRIFVNSMSDLFHDEIPDEFIARVFAVMALAPQHTFQVLTKRHGRMRALLNSQRFRDIVDDAHYAMAKDLPKEQVLSWSGSLAMPNVWLGVSVENQQWANIRIPALLDTPAAVRFLSCEPLLGPVDLDTQPWRPIGKDLPRIDWVIVGGESGRGARPMHPDWARSLRDQCTAAGVAFHFKQHGEWVQVPAAAGQPGDMWLTPDLYPTLQPWRPGTEGAPAGKWDTHADVLVRRVGKKAAGRELDGRTWDEFPDTAGA